MTVDISDNTANTALGVHWRAARYVLARIILINKHTAVGT